MPVFKTGAINHSANSPRLLQFYYSELFFAPVSLSLTIVFNGLQLPADLVHWFSRPTVSTTHTSLRKKRDVLGVVYNTSTATPESLHAEGARVKFHYLRKMGHEISEAVVAGIEMILVLNSFFT